MESKSPKLKRRRVRKPKTFKSKLKGLLKKKYKGTSLKSIILIVFLSGVFAAIFYFHMLNPSSFVNQPAEKARRVLLGLE